jgi:sterol desaturase/sphingolipid hydroxylase (fatty acid hydroxylase superfamily)
MMNLDDFSGVTVRLSIFLGMLALMSVLEALAPLRVRTQKRSDRWIANLGLVILGSLAIRLLGPFTAVIAAGFAITNGWGFIPILNLPFYIEIVLAVVLLDLTLYGQHVASHKIPFIWRLHRVHHADRDMDATTGVRFHPVESVLSMLYKCFMVIILGPAVIAVVVFEVILNASALFNHANLRLPGWLDAILRILFVTPDMHSVHHSVLPNETNSNYGFFLSIWDKIFSSYIAHPKLKPDSINIGLPIYQSEQPSSLWWNLKLPIQK